MKHMKIQRNRYLWKILCMALIMLVPMKVHAAFPNNLQEKPMNAYSLVSDEVSVFQDAAMTEEISKVEGDGLILTAQDVSYDQLALYGFYKNSITGESGTGWIPASIFLYDHGFKHSYATVRSSMMVYTSSSLEKSRAEIKKYSGIIALGKANDAVQIVYEKGKTYGIGWISAEDYDNRLVYDGRDKQILANGTYSFSTASEVAKAGNSADTTTTPIPPSQTFKLIYLGKNLYRIFDVKQDKYLKVDAIAMKEDVKESEPEWLSHGPMHYIKKIFSSSYNEKVKKWEKEKKERKKQREELKRQLEDGEIYEDPEKECCYVIAWTEEESQAVPFLLTRQGDYFNISWNKSSLYFGNNEKQAYIVGKDQQENTNYQWRARAVTSLVDPSNPMVFTQYDPQWCGKDYGTEGCIGTAGCGLLATVNAVYALTGQYMSVMELRDYAVEKGYRIEGNGTDEGIFKAAAVKYGDKYGFAWDGDSGDINKLKSKLQEGDVAVVHVIGHYVAITAYDAKKDKYLLLDSNCLPKRETSAFGDWISPSRLMDGYLYGQNYYFFKLKP